MSSFCPFVDEREYCYRKLLNYSVSKVYFKSFENLHVDFLFDVDQEKSLWLLGYHVSIANDYLEVAWVFDDNSCKLLIFFLASLKFKGESK